MEITSLWTKISGLEPSTKYCIVDTSVLLPLCWDNPEIIADVKRVASNSSLMLLSSVVNETRLKYDGLENSERTTKRTDFVSFLSCKLESNGFEFELVQEGIEISNLVKKMDIEKIHANLSPVDYTILVAKKYPDADVITLDGGLAGSINKERGKNSKSKTPFSYRCDYRDKRSSTAGCIKYALGSIIKKDDKILFDDLRLRTKFLLNGKEIVSIDHIQGGSVTVNLLSLVRKRDKKIVNKEKKLENQIRKHFFQWKYKGVKKGPKRVDAQKRRFYTRQQRDDDDFV